jgi:hypothetical protein
MSNSTSPPRDVTARTSPTDWTIPVNISRITNEPSGAHFASRLAHSDKHFEQGLIKKDYDNRRSVRRTSSPIRSTACIV